MTRDDIVRWAKEAGWKRVGHNPDTGPEFPVLIGNLERFAALAVADEREACAKVCEEKQTYSMPIPCPDGISGCCVNHVVPARREKTGTECAAAIRARNTQEKPR